METLNYVLDLLERYNISFVLSFIINFPFENENDINKTLDTMYCINNRYHLKRDMPETFVSDLCFFPIKIVLIHIRDPLWDLLGINFGFY